MSSSASNEAAGSASATMQRVPEAATSSSGPTLEPLDKLFPLADFKNVAFRVIGPFLRSKSRFAYYDQLANACKEAFKDVDVLVGLDSRGYLIAEVIAQRLPSLPGVVMAAKMDKLAGDVVTGTGSKEYGATGFQIARDAIQPGQRVLVVDDVLATGGSVSIVRRMIEHDFKAVFVGIVCLVELDDLEAATEVFPLHPIVSLAKYKAIRTRTEVEMEEQPVLVPQVLTEGVAHEADAGPSAADAPIVIATFPSMLQTGLHLQSYAPHLIRQCNATWAKFPDGSHNDTLEDMDKLCSFQKHLIFAGSFYDFANITEQFAMCTALTGQPAKSHTLSWPYLPFTHERVTRMGGHQDAAGMTQFTEQAVATAHTLSKQLCGAVSGRPIFRFFDIHVEAARFYANDKDLIPLELSMLPSFLKLLDTEYKHVAGSNDVNMIVFPDDGALKRFSRYFDARSDAIATCVKKRGAGEIRAVTLKDVYKLERGMVVKNIFIVDDLLDSGATLKECALVMRAAYPDAPIMSYVTHARCARNSHLRFAAGGEWAGIFAKMYVTNTIPEVADKLRHIAPFLVIDTEPILLHNYVLQMGLAADPRVKRGFYGKIHVSVASTNQDKLRAIEYGFKSHFPYAASVVVVQARSTSALGNADESKLVNEQPLGFTETMRGCINRMKRIRSALDVSDTNFFSVVVESGAFKKRLTESSYVDQALILIRHDNTGRTVTMNSRTVPMDTACFKASEATGRMVPAGAYIARTFGRGLTASNWQSHWMLDRVDQIKQTVDTCLYSFSL